MARPIDLLSLADEELSALADADRARQMAAYMKTHMAFYGVQAPARRKVLRSLRAQVPISTSGDYAAAVATLWDGDHRETKYLAIDLAIAERRFIASEHLPLYRRLIVEGAWWDLVDPVATHLVGTVLLNDPHHTEPVIASWAFDDDVWLRRTAILCRLRHKDRTDAGRLFSQCLARAGDDEFFIRKAIGWALREYAKTDPEAVGRFLIAHRGDLSPLSFREASKHLDLPDEGRTRR